MTREELKTKYQELYGRVYRKGRSVKYGAFGFIIMESLYAIIGGQNKNGISTSDAAIFIRVFIILLIILFAAILVLPIKTFDFLSSGVINEIKNSYKSDMFAVITTESAEITKYIPNQKIHPTAFRKSKLFPYPYTDYLGDDWIQGFYKSVEFELCELRVYNSFEVIFNGIFLRCFFTTSTINQINNFNHYNEVFHNLKDDFESKYKAIIRISTIDDSLYLAFQRKGHFFEFTPKKLEVQIDSDLNMIKDIIEITKCAINQRDLN